MDLDEWDEASERKEVEECFCNRLRVGPSVQASDNGLAVVNKEPPASDNDDSDLGQAFLPSGHEPSFLEGLEDLDWTLRKCPFPGVS